MDFRSLLLQLEKWPEYFTSRNVALKLDVSIKQISGDLKRLHTMGFLKRRRRKRLCLSKNGKLCYKGYEFRYSISKQGRSYLAWMKRDEATDDIYRIEYATEIMQHLPQNIQEVIVLKALIESCYQYRGPPRRFRLLGKEVFIAMLLVENLNLKNQVSSLTLQNLLTQLEKIALEQKNSKLMQDIESHQKALDFLLVVLKEKNQIISKHNEEISQVTIKIAEIMIRNRVNFLDFLSVPNLIIKILQRQNSYLFAKLVSSLPEAELNKLSEVIRNLEQPLFEALNRKIQGIKEGSF